MQRSLTLILLLFVLLTTHGLRAQEAAAADVTADAGVAAATEPATEEEEKAFPFEFTGAVDAYYQYGFRGTPFPTSFTGEVDGFSLGMLQLMLAKKGKVGFVADIAFGPRAEVANGFVGTSLSMIKQLYVTYSPADWITFTGGNFATFIGYELIDAPKNINYSMSYMFTNGPFFHTGIKADLTFSEHFAGMIGIFDDTDSKFDFVPGKHLGGQLSYGVGDFKVYLNYLSGKTAEADSLSPDVITNQIDVVATYALSDKFSLGFNATQKALNPSEGETTKWSAAALYANYIFSPAFNLGVRGEYVNDKDGLILGLTDNSVTALTLSGNIHIGGLTVIPEFRADFSSKQVFFDKEGGDIDKVQPGFIVSAVYAF